MSVRQKRKDKKPPAVKLPWPIVADGPDRSRRDPVPEPRNLPPMLQDPAPEIRLPKVPRVQKD